MASPTTNDTLGNLKVRIIAFDRWTNPEPLPSPRDIIEK
ncbi:hypothetical protein CORTU0001_0603 [Corynebacterium tuberculostearicum SK141]|uniref:Uncharacterized protein n=1 Tax=Corynebacterium tuberculostearicum SK141 TaxID=553206 RepID=C6R9N6_9CORY|nr:hypothetical protein CORTU0001_0603 [Corynebacterium tuberculostearicum SK141]